jgi:hypothetical protein
VFPVSGVLLALAVLLVLGVTGAPIVLCLPHGRSGVAGIAFESIAIGLLAQEVIGLVALRSGHYSRPTVLVLTVLVIVGAVLVWSRRTGSSTRGWNWRRPAVAPSLLGVIVAVGLLIVVGVALALRQGPSYFIFETGDMGEYVNGANVLAQTGRLAQSFPHGFTVLLGSTNLLLGQAHTVAALPALGVLLVLGAFAYARVIGLHPLAALGIAALVAVHPVTVWFSLFPVSESLYGVLLIAALYFLARARSDSSIPYAVVAGLFIGVMLLVRGNAMLLAPITVLALLASAAIDDDTTVRVQRRFTVVALLSLSVAYAYDLHYPRTYFVQNQLRGLLPHSLFKVGNRLQLFSVSVPLVIALAVGLVVVLRATLLVTRFVRPRVVDRPVVFWRYAYGILLGASAVAAVFMHHAGLLDALARWGIVLLALTLVGIAAIFVRPGRYLDGVDGSILVMTICAYSLLFMARVPVSKPHAYYLYYDRYLFSEVLPAALVLAAIGLHFFVEAFVSVTTSRAVVVRVAIIGLAIVAALAFFPNVKETHRITRYPLFGDSYQTLHRIDTLTHTDGNGAIVYSAPPVPPAGWFFQNTYRAFALPLGETFRRTVVGLPKDPFGSDVQFDAATARATLQKSGFDRGYLVSLRAPGTKVRESDPHARYLGTVDYVSPILRRTVKRSPAIFQLVPFQFDVYALS